MRNAYDVVVLGGGSAGHAAAAEAVALGLDTALIENADVLGGLCIQRGCMPSKTLLESAQHLRAIRAADEFGINAGASQLDVAALQQRRQRLVESFRGSREAEMHDGRYDLIRGRAVFLNPHQIEIEAGMEKYRCRAEAFIIATGSRPHVPDLPGLAETPFWTSDQALEFSALPASIAIVGAGPLAMEFAHAFEGYGSDVHLIYRKAEILSAFPPDAAAVVARASARRGIHMHAATEVARVTHGAAGFDLELQHGATRAELRCEALLIATGRSAAIESLQLPKAGVVTSGGRILSDRNAVTSVPHIFAAGDCTSPVAVVHLAVLQGQVAARNAARIIGSHLGEEKASWNPRFAIAAVFTEPAIIRLGLDVEQARGRGFDPVTARAAFADNGKAVIAGATDGFVELLADRSTGELLGALAAGPQVIESAHAAMTAICARMSAADFAAVPCYHPTLVELWADAAAALAKKTAPGHPDAGG